jgi:hypothetical protein
MPKRKTKVKVILVDYTEVNEDINKPFCFGEKCSYCRAELCGHPWFERCINKDSSSKVY